MTYITSLVPQEQRKQFNSFRSLITSGAFLVGPAIAGFLLIFTSAQVAIWISAISFLISAFILNLLPNLERQGQSEQSQTLSLKVLMNDWGHVNQFSRKNAYIVKIYFIVQLFFVMALGMDAQEVVFTQKVLGLSEADYGFLISITGIGAILGAATVSVFAKKLSLRLLMGIGFLIVALGYIIYAFSFSFMSVAIGFIILGYFYAFANTGFMTFYQNNVPIHMMGRILSVFGTFQSVFQIVFIMLIGFTGEIIPLRYSIVVASLLVVFTSLLLIIMIYHPSRKIHYNEDSSVLKL
jgi:MFS family permease